MLLPGGPVDRVHQEGRRLLPAQEPDRRDVVHRQLPAVLPADEIVAHDHVRLLLAEGLDRLVPERLERRPVGVEDAVVAVADGHRLGQRVDDAGEAALHSLECLLEPDHEAGALRFGLARTGDVLDERVERPAVLPGDGRDRHLDGKLAPVDPQGQQLPPLAQAKPGAGFEEAAQGAAMLVAEALG